MSKYPKTVIPALPGYFILETLKEDGTNNVIGFKKCPVLAWCIQYFPACGEESSEEGEWLGRYETHPITQRDREIGATFYPVLNPQGQVDLGDYGCFDSLKEYLAYVVECEAK